MTGTFALTLDIFNRSLAMLAANRIDIASIISEEMPLTDIKRGIDMMIMNEGLKKHIIMVVRAYQQGGRR